MLEADLSCCSRNSEFERPIHASICSLLALWDLVNEYSFPCHLLLGPDRLDTLTAFMSIKASSEHIIIVLEKKIIVTGMAGNVGGVERKEKISPILRAWKNVELQRSLSSIGG